MIKFTDEQLREILSDKFVLENGECLQMHSHAVGQATERKWPLIGKQIDGRTRWVLAIPRPPNAAELEEMGGCMFRPMGEGGLAFLTTYTYMSAGNPYIECRGSGGSGADKMYSLSDDKYRNSAFRRPGPRGPDGKYEWFPVWRLG